ncbi:MAG: TMEM175 family protein [Planctomycetota bacterium]|nr:TMEM175 family protein [Planctomycetota bacterium]
MFRQQLHALHAQGERDFRWRGGDVSRIEGLTDGVFALAVALLVISLQVPQTFDELIEAFRQTPVFLATFSILYLCWHSHFKFHRRYGLEDPLTLLLNGALIFLVALYVYPLKFLMSALWNGLILGRGSYVRDTRGERVESEVAGEYLMAFDPSQDMADLMVLYGLGFAAVFGVFALMTWRAWIWRDRLELDDRERLLTKAGMTSHVISVAVGSLSALWAGLGGAPAVAGFGYFLMGPLQGWCGWHFGRQVEALRPERELDENPADDPVPGP